MSPIASSKLMGIVPESGYFSAIRLAATLPA